MKYSEAFKRMFNIYFVLVFINTIMNCNINNREILLIVNTIVYTNY